MNKVVITGPTGAIGIALIYELIKNEVEVLAIVRKNSKRIDNIPINSKVKIIKCDLEDFASIEMPEAAYDVFYHFAWEATSGIGRNDLDLQLQNVQYSLDAVRLAKRLGCKIFIGAGSQAEYGRCNEALTSRTPSFPENGYGIAKLCAGQMTRELAHQLGLQHIWVRVLSVYGPYDNPNSMIMYLIDTLRRGLEPKCTKGEQVWDFVFSYDAARAFRLLAQKGTDGEVYVLGSGIACHLSDFIIQIRDTVSPDAEIHFGAIPYATNQVMYLEADITSLRKLGWTPTYKFIDGVKIVLKELDKE